MGQITEHREKPFKINLDINEKDFISPPMDSQREWVIRCALKELAEDLIHINKLTKRFVDGSERTLIRRQTDWSKSKAHYDDTQLIIEDQQVMQSWEWPYMKAMAKAVTEGQGDVLELGFGMGISATYIQEFGCRSYTVVEYNEDVQKKFAKWKENYPGRDIRLIPGKWQDVVDQLDNYDGIFFDTYHLSEEEFVKYIIEDVTFGAHFFETAANHLRDGGVFSYYSNEIDSVSRRTQRRLFQYFKSISFEVVDGLKPPPDCDYWWADAMVVVRARK